MNRFTHVLSELDSRLTVLEPARSRIVLEVAADMEDLFQEYLLRGYSEEDAGIAVADHFNLSDDALQELILVHDTPFQRSLENLSGQVRGVGSRTLMAVLAILVAIGSGSLLFRGQLYRDASGLVWAVMPMLGWGLWVAGGHLRMLFGTKEDLRAGFRSGLGRLLGLAALMMGVTCAGLWVELYLSGLRIRAAPTETMIHLVGWVHMASATLVIALSGALVLGFLWFFLTSAARLRELTAVTVLLGGNGR